MAYKAGQKVTIQKWTQDWAFLDKDGDVRYEIDWSDPSNLPQSIVQTPPPHEGCMLDFRGDEKTMSSFLQVDEYRGVTWEVSETTTDRPDDKHRLVGTVVTKVCGKDFPVTFTFVCTKKVLNPHYRSKNSAAYWEQKYREERYRALMANSRDGNFE